MISMRIAQFCVAAGTGALLGGTAVHIADKPKKPRIARIAPKTDAGSCNAMTGQQMPEQVAAIPETIQTGSMTQQAASLPNSPVLLSNPVVPQGRSNAAVSAVSTVPEPAAAALLGMGVLGVAVLKSVRRKR